MGFLDDPKKLADEHDDQLIEKSGDFVDEKTGDKSLEPGVMSTKLYAQGVGIVREQDIAGGHESFEVVAVRHR